LKTQAGVTEPGAWVAGRGSVARGTVRPSGRQLGRQGRVVGVAVLAAAVEARHVGLVELGAGLQTLDQVGIGQEGPSEAEQVGFAAVDRGLRGPQVGRSGEAGVEDERPLPLLADLLAEVGLGTFDDVQVQQAERREPVEQGGVRRLGLGLGDVVERAPGRDPMPTRPAPMASDTALATSITNRARFCGDPPYPSVRMLVLSDRNYCSR